MDDQSGHVMTLANSIIGVSVLAMPYCFKQCGIILSILMLLISSIISRLACHFLLKSAIIARRKTFEFLAFYIFGAMGKFAIEIGIIGFLIGTCIAFFVVMGDLAPEIISEVTGTYTTNTMRTSILMALALFCVLPLGLLRNVDSLNGVSRATIGFYCCLVLKIVFEAIPRIFSTDWYNNVIFWRPAGILQCLPIFSMALFCQTQLFEIYQALQNATLEKMNNLIRVAVNICTWVYIFVGVFGYIAFSQKPFTGNILMSFSPSLMTDIMKIGFVLSVAFSFPLVIFPCRASLYSLLYKEGYSVHEGVSNYIPEGKFKGLTMFIVFISLIIGIMIPNIELVLGLVGSTIGVMICVLFPVTCFICISPKNTNERILAQLMLMVGVFVMVLGTYKNLYSLDNLEPNTVTISSLKNLDQFDLNAVKLVDNIGTQKNAIEKIAVTIKAVNIENNVNSVDKVKSELTTMKIVETDQIKEVRHEPPQPIEPQEEINQIKKIDSNQNMEKIVDVPATERYKKVQITTLKIDKMHPLANINITASKNEQKNEEVDIEAIKKEDQEVALQEKEKIKEDDTNKVLIDTIQKQNEVQKEIAEQQKKLIEVNEEKLKAVKQIQSIAQQAIEKISGGKDGVALVADLERNMVNVAENIKQKQGNGNKAESAKMENVVNQDENKDSKGSKRSVVVDEPVRNIRMVDNKKNGPPEVVENGKHSKHFEQNLETRPAPDDKNNQKLIVERVSGNVIQNKNNANPVKVEPNVQVLKQPEQNENMKHNISALLINNSNSNINNTAPLFLKLGKSEPTVGETGFKKMIPLPLVMSNSLVKDAYNLSKREASVVDPEKDMPNEMENVLALNNHNDNLQAIRRDILSFKNKR